MSYRNPASILIEALFKSYPYMDLADKLMLISALTKAIDPKFNMNVGKLVAKARELELLVEISVKMYLQGELSELSIPEELEKLYNVENDLLARFFSFYLRPKKQGVEKYV